MRPRLRRNFDERGENRLGIQARGEIANKSFHPGVPEAAETEEIHFVHGLLGSPFVEGHAIGRDEDARAILAEAAMHEDFVPRIGPEKREKQHKLFIGGSRPATDRDIQEAHAERFDKPSLPLDFFGVITAQIDDRSDT